MGKERVIFHIDCNAFYASVEEILHPELKQVPMAICGDPESRRGIILAKNELAKQYQVKTAETIWQAKRKCPNLVLRPARHPLYSEYCEMVNAVYQQYTDQVERFGRDESYLDVTGSLHLFGGDPVRLAHEIRKRVPRELGLTVSVGVSFNKIFAKLASDMKKPNAVSVISRENYRQVVWPMPVSAMMMVGDATEHTLRDMRIETLGQLAQADGDRLYRRLGKLGEQLHLYANGEDASPVLHIGEEAGPQSIGNSITFKRNLLSLDDVKTAVAALSDSVAVRMRRHGQKCQGVQVTIKDSDFKVITRQKVVQFPTWLAADLAQEAMELIQKAWTIGKPIRMLAVTAYKLLPADEAVEQTSLFEAPEVSINRKKQEMLELTLDKIRCKYGSSSITPGIIVGNDLGIHESYGAEEEA